MPFCPTCRKIRRWLWEHVGKYIYDCIDQLCGAAVVILCATVICLILLAVFK